MKKFKLAALTAVLGTGMLLGVSQAAIPSMPQMSGLDAAGAALQGLADDPQLRQLYSEGLVIPNQPLPMKESERQAARDYVQKFIDVYSAQSGGFKKEERRVINALLFNYGLQLLDNNQVGILEVYNHLEDGQVVSGSLTPQLAPGIPLGEDTVITRENARELYDRAVEERKKLEAEIEKQRKLQQKASETTQESYGLSEGESVDATVSSGESTTLINNSEFR